MTDRTRASAENARDALLRAALGHVERHGISDLSLRELAAAIGTSHRMLIYHFGSKEGLEVAIVQAVERAQQVFLTQLLEAEEADPAGVIRTMWRRLADPALAGAERLFFEVYVLALQRRPGTGGFLEGVVDSWVNAATERAVRIGIDERRARADVRLGVAVMRGLLLDLLATGDRAGVDAAVERYLELYAPPG